MAEKQSINEIEQKKQETYYQNAWKGDYSQFEKLNPEKREELAVKYMEAVSRRHPQLGVTRPDSGVLDDLLKEQAMNPAFRLGCSLRAKSGDRAADNYKGYDDFMNTYLMEQSLTPLDNTRLENLKKEGLTGEKLNQAVEQNIEKQVMLAKTLFMAHLGKAQLVEAGAPGQAPQREELDRPVASMMAHCSRTAYVFPPGDSAQQNKLFDSVLGPDMGKAAGVHRRMAATHSVASGPSIDDFKELKKLSLTNQYGMNIAIGGAGNPGIGGPDGPQTLKNDGSCGHMYMHVDKGGVNKCSSLLVGFESDAPGVTNQLGHTHDTKATPESMSSFLGQRTDEMGAKYGGRIVDFTHIPLDKLERTVSEFTDHYRAMLTAGMGNPEVGKELEQINSTLCGYPMTSPTLSTMMGSMGINTEKQKSFLTIPEYTYWDVVPQKSVSDLNVAAPPKKPGLLTRFKASIGNADAKKACQEHKDYQSILAKRAEDHIVPAEPKRENREGSLQQLIGDITNTPWKAAKPDDLRRPVPLRDLQLKDEKKIGNQRTKLPPKPTKEKEHAPAETHSDKKSPAQKNGMTR